MHKNIITVGLILLFSVTLNADYTDQERIRDMKTMEDAMIKIQKGLLTNDKNTLSKGVNQLQQVTRKVEPPVDTKSILKQKNTYKKVLDECISCHNKIRKWQDK
jgi:cytochrome c556